MVDPSCSLIVMYVNTQDFILTALKTANYRLDGRTGSETRPVGGRWIARCIDDDDD